MSLQISESVIVKNEIAQLNYKSFTLDDNIESVRQMEILPSNFFTFTITIRIVFPFSDVTYYYSSSASSLAHLYVIRIQLIKAMSIQKYIILTRCKYLDNLDTHFAKSLVIPDTPSSVYNSYKFRVLYSKPYIYTSFNNRIILTFTQEGIYCIYRL